MNCAVIDIGSNTMKLCVYALDDNGIQTIHRCSDYASVLSFVDQDILHEDGIHRIKQTLLDFLDHAAVFGCSPDANNFYCFSTASLRRIKNQKDVIDDIKNTTGIELKSISGEEEAFCNYLSMKHFLHTDDFLGMDLGGGSAQLFCSVQGQLINSHSYPIGGNRLYRRFVKGDLPDEVQAAQISEYVTNQIVQEGMNAGGSTVIYLMGGTMRLAAEILGDCHFTQNELAQLAESFVSHPSKAQKIISSLKPQRMKSFLPGIIAVSVIMQYYGIHEGVSVGASVREGYLITQISKGL